MPRQDDVIPGEPIEAVWGNPIRDTTIQRTASEAQRDIEWPIPVLGDLAFIEDLATIQFYNGASWVSLLVGAFLPLAGGTMTGPILLNGQNLTDVGSISTVNMNQRAGQDLNLTDSAAAPKLSYLNATAQWLARAITTTNVAVGDNTPAFRNVHTSTVDPTTQGIEGDVGLTYA